MGEQRREKMEKSGVSRVEFIAWNTYARLPRRLSSFYLTEPENVLAATG